MTNDDRALEATARLYPNGARGSVRRLLVRLFEEEVSAGAERHNRHAEQHVSDHVGLAHRVDVTRLAMRGAALELILLVSPIERVHTPSAERHEAYAAKHVRERVATSTRCFWLGWQGFQCVARRREASDDSAILFARTQRRGQQLAAAVLQRQREAVSSRVELQGTTIELRDGALSVDRCARSFDGSTVGILGDQHDARRHRHDRLTERHALTANHCGARRRRACHEVLLCRKQTPRVALELACRMRFDTRVSRARCVYRKREQEAAAQQRKREAACSPGAQKHASLKRLTPFFSITYGTSQSFTGFGRTGLADFAAALRGPSTEDTLCRAGTASACTAASSTGSRAAAVTKSGAGKAACAAATGVVGSVGARRLRPHNTKEAIANVAVTGTSQPLRNGPRR